MTTINVQYVHDRHDSDIFEPAQNKFSCVNIQRYVDWALWIVRQNPLKLKYIDECHFVSCQLHRRLAVGPVGERTFALLNDKLDGNERLTLTLCTSISRDASQHTCWAAATFENNTGSNFAHVIFQLISTGFLQQGDILVLDNARVSASSYLHNTLSSITFLNLSSMVADSHTWRCVSSSLRTFAGTRY